MATDWIAARRAELDRLFETRLAPPADGDPGRLLEAMRYSLLAPGKRIRPLLALAAAETVSPVASEPADVLLACAAVELVHCYSLIHDDLPAMDDDDFRRGNPTNHKAFGEATAILAGDALLTEAFILLSSPGNLPPETRLAVISEIAFSAGSKGMVGGQVVDMESEGKPEIDFPTVQYIHAHKTGALIKA